MLPFPNVPTDNLYKFIALSGVVLFFLSGSFLFVEQRDYVNRQTDLIELLGRITAEGDRLPDTASAVTRWDTAEIILAIGRMDSLRVEHSSKAAAANLQKLNHKVIQIICAVGMLVGVLIADQGFRLWRDRLQRYQDMIVKAEAERITPPTDAKQAPPKT